MGCRAGKPQKHLNTYDEMYSAADSLLKLFRDYMNGYINIDEDRIVVPGSLTISKFWVALNLTQPPWHNSYCKETQMLS